MSLVDTRTIGRLPDFSGKAQDWQEWVFRARAWLSLLGEQGQYTVDDLLVAAENSNVAVAQGNLGPGATNFSVILYNLLMQITRGRAAGIVRSVPRSAGLEAWRLLHVGFQPSPSLF